MRQLIAYLVNVIILYIAKSLESIMVEFGLCVCIP